MCWLPNSGLLRRNGLRDGGVLFGDGEYHFVVLFLGECIQVRDEGGLDGFGGHESGDDGYFVDCVDAGGRVVGVKFFL